MTVTNGTHCRRKVTQGADYFSLLIFDFMPKWTLRPIAKQLVRFSRGMTLASIDDYDGSSAVSSLQWFDKAPLFQS